MNKIRLGHHVLRILTVFFTLTLFVNVFAATDYLKGKYNVDPVHSRISFIVPHFVVSEVEGRFNDVKGEFTLAEPFTESRVIATIPVKSIDTGSKERDDHLLAKDFFEATKYPEMKLVSKSINGTPESFKMIAALTIKGVTKDVILDCKYTGSVKDPWGQQRAALKATAKVNRRDFNINYNDRIGIGPAVGDEVKIRLWTEGIKAEDSQKGNPMK
ncbi:MAG: YceI family protein [Candidatus Brocadia sp.]|nr:YceI family protein [Candidatus Brocadia sp.]